MPTQKNKMKVQVIYISKIVLFGLGLILCWLFTHSVSAQSNISPVEGYAWSSNIGWICFDCGTANVQLNTDTGNISGYAWSSNIGWIDFTGVNVPPAGGLVTGWASALSSGGGWDGQIKMSGSWSNGVSYSSATGIISGYAWGSDVVGWLQFSNVSVTVAPPPPPGAPIVIFGANPETIDEGNSSNLEWTVTGADSCTATGVPTTWSGAKAFNGSNSQPVSPLVTTTYNLECWNAGISSGIKSVTVYVNPAILPPGAPIVTITADKDYVDPNTEVILTWTVSGTADTCQARSQPNTIVNWNGSKPFNPSNSQIVTPTQSTRFNIRCANAGAYSAWEQVFVNVNAPNPPSTTFEANPEIIDEGESSVLRWTVTGADYCQGFEGSEDWRGIKAHSGSNDQTVSPLDTTTYELLCSNGPWTDGTKTATVTVIPLAPPSIFKITSDKKFIRGDAAEVANLEWQIEALYNLTCSVKGPGGVSVNNIDVVGGDPVTIGQTTTTPLKNTGLFTLSCIKGSKTFEDTVTVEIIPGTQEL